MRRRWKALSQMRSELPGPLARAHAWARTRPWLARFTLANRLLLAMAFLPTGLVKASGQRFTVLPMENPIGFFFEAMYRTGPYWVFIGLVQVLAAVLLLIPSTATLGALLFLPIAISIFLITWGVGFGNTVFIAGGMLLSVVYLICWDGERIWKAGAHLLSPHESAPLLDGAHVVERVGWVTGATVGMALWLATRGFVPFAWVPALLVVGVGALALVVLGWALPKGSRPGR